MKKIFFPVVLVVTVLLGGVLAYSIWNAKPLTAQGYFESGKAYYDQQKYPEAIIQFLNAVRKDDRSRDARFFLAMSFLRQQDINHAVGELRTLLEYYPDDVEANLQLGGIYLTGGRFNPELFHQAQEIARNMLTKDPNNVAALVLSGHAFAGLQDYRSSVDLFEKALGLDPQNLAAFVSLGTSQALQKNYPEAERAYLKAREVDPKDKNALVSLANYYRATGDLNKAESMFKEAVSIYPADKTIYFQLVEFYYGQNRIEDAVKVLRDAQAASAENPEPSLLLVDLYMSKDRPSDARNLLLELKDKFASNLDVAAKLALSFLQDQPDRARAEIDRIIKAEPNNPVGHMLLGQLQFLSGEYDASEATLNKPPAVDSPFPQVHFFLGNIAMRKGQIDQALFHYQKSLAVNGRYVPARVALAEVFLAKGKVADSKEEIRKALEVRSDFVPARLVKATLDSAEKNFDGAEKELAALAKEQPGNPLVYRQMAVYYDARGRTAEAEKNLLRALEIQPDSEQILRDLTLFYIRGKQAEKAVQKISAISDDKKQAVHYELLGLAYAQGGKHQDAEAAFKRALQKEPGRNSTDTYLFSEYMRHGRVDDGLKKLDEMIQRNPSNASMYSVRAQIFEGQGKRAEAKQNYEQALKIDPTFEVAANNLAYILGEEGTDLQTALGYAQTARKKQPDNAAIADTLGWIYYKMGNNVLARDQLQFAVSKDPNNAIFLYHLGMIYKANKQTSEALIALKKAANHPKDFTEKSLAQAALKEITN